MPPGEADDHAPVAGLKLLSRLMNTPKRMIRVLSQANSVPQARCRLICYRVDAVSLSIESSAAPVHVVAVAEIGWLVATAVGPFPQPGGGQAAGIGSTRVGRIGRHGRFTRRRVGTPCAAG